MNPAEGNVEGLHCMKNYKFILEYDGSRYYGWQRQPDKNTIQGKLENVLSLMCGKETEVIGAGRTDAGVHSKGMAANAFLETDFSCGEIRDYMNRSLPDDICGEGGAGSISQIPCPLQCHREDLLLHLLRGDGEDCL